MAAWFTLSALAIAGCQCGGVAHLEPVPFPAAPRVDGMPRLRGLDRDVRLVRALHIKKLPAKPGEWLSQHEEEGQTFSEWRDINPVVPDRRRNKLYVQPLGTFTPTQRRIVMLTADYMERFFGIPTKILPDLDIGLIPVRATRRHPEDRGHQILTGYILSKVLRPRLPVDAAAYISLTAHDLWPGTGWNFVFGQASLRNRVGVWSLHRFGDPDESKASFNKTLMRTLKVAVHETGHMFSMKHCTAYECVMGGSNHLRETDEAPLWLGPECMAKIAWAAKLTPKERYRRLAEFATANDFEREAVFFDASIAAIAGIQPK